MSILSLTNQPLTFALVGSYLDKNEDLNHLLIACKAFHNKRDKVQETVCRNLGFYHRFKDCDWPQTSAKLKQLFTGKIPLLEWTLFPNKNDALGPNMRPNKAQTFRGDKSFIEGYYAVYRSHKDVYFCPSSQLLNQGKPCTVMHYALNDKGKTAELLGQIEGLKESVCDSMCILHEALGVALQSGSLAFWHLKSHRLLIQFPTEFTWANAISTNGTTLFLEVGLQPKESYYSTEL